MQPGTGKAVWILGKRLGWRRLPGLLWRLVRAEQRGEPFRHLPPPENDKERLSRQQIGPGIILYKELKKLVTQEQAMDIAQEAIIAGAIAFLKRSIGPLKREKLSKLNEEERRAFVEEKGARFFNATMQWDVITGDEVSFTVVSCRFPRLCQEAGVPELAPAFCQGDATFFGSVEPGVSLERPQTIATGAQSCLFSLKWSEEAKALEASSSTDK